MNTRTKVAFALFGLAYLTAAVFGLMYATRGEFMPYHAEAISTKWSDLPASYQVLFLALLKVAGGGMLAVAAAGAFLLIIPFRQQLEWSRWALLAVIVITSAITLYATLTVDLQTPANPPTLAPILTIALGAVAAALTKFEEAGKAA
ncbi:MAG: hypothetical protein JXA21_15150 [Anaerolineae bacterium]|nr:hypothetical protein [Anaerolineae bacterium]